MIARPALGQTLSLVISSPSAGATFATGQTVTIDAMVSDGGSPVSGATVTANSPTGTTIALTPATTAGTYSVAYGLAPTTPTGTWTITVVATSGGMTQSAHVAVLIASGSLVVTFVAPASGTLFNAGETVALRAVVTNPDGTAIPSSSAVTFTKPNGLTAAMATNPTDPSGRTWVASYTIMSSDALPQGFDWPITITATVGTSTGSAVQHVSLFNSLEVTASTFSTNAYTTPQNAFVAGQTAFVKAAVTLHDGTQVSSGSASFEISGTSVASSPIGMTYSPSLAAWTGSYLILPTDQIGAQFVTVSATDAQGNTGSGIHVISLSTGSSQGLSVFITAPAANTVFNRGETVTITTLVTLNGAPVAGATVTANSPGGALIALTNTAGGAYTRQYTVLSTDPIGTWNLVVQAGLNGLSASKQEPLTVSNSLRVTVATYGSSSYSTPQSSFSAGQTIFVKARVTLQDGTAVTSGTAAFVLTGASISATPVALAYSSTLNAWTGSYTVLQSDQTGNQALTTTVADLTGNTGSGSITVMIGVATTSSTPLEAGITFNPTTHDIQVNAICGAGCVAPTTVTQTSAAPGSASQNDEGHGDGDGHGNGHGHGHQDGNDNGGYTNRTYTIADSGGHVVTLIIQVQNNGNEIKASIVSIQYGNSSPVTPADNKLDFQYSLADNGRINTLDENAAGGNATGHAHYDAKKGVTSITMGSGGDGGEGDDSGDNEDGGDGGQNTITNSGLWLLELTTSDGSLGLSYFQSA